LLLLLLLLLIIIIVGAKKYLKVTFKNSLALQQKEVAELFGISAPTLSKNYTSVNGKKIGIFFSFVFLCDTCVLGMMLLLLLLLLLLLTMVVCIAGKVLSENKNSEVTRESW
jgi:hypothetical protein